MKKRNRFFAGLLILSLCSCEGLFYNPDGKVVRFSASAGDDVRTKTEYSGAVSGREIERINWQDNDPVTVYMYWITPEGDTETDKPEHSATYKVNFKDDNRGERSYGKLVHDNGGPLMWKGDASHVYTHYFYSIYPADKGSFEPNGVGSNPSITFNLPSDQREGATRDMQFAYMAAAAPAVETAPKGDYSKAVNLDYYPMVTTIYVNILNESKKELSEVALTSTSAPLVGDYTVTFASRETEQRPFTATDTGMDGEKTVTVTKSIPGGTSGDLAFFIRPRTYDPGTLTLSLTTLGGETKTIGNLNRGGGISTLEPFHKYNIAIKIDENGTATPPPTIDDIQWNGDAQLLLGFLFALNEWGSSPSLSEFLPVDDINWLNNNFRNRNITISDLQTINKKYPDLFQAIFDSATHLKLAKDIGVPITDNISSTIFKLFKNLTEITILVNPNDGNFITIDVEDLPNLTNITLDGNKEVHLTVKNCPSLQSVGKNNNSSTSVSVDGKAW